MKAGWMKWGRWLIGHTFCAVAAPAEAPRAPMAVEPIPTNRTVAAVTAAALRSFPEKGYPSECSSPHILWLADRGLEGRLSYGRVTAA